MQSLLIQRKGEPLEFSYKIIWEDNFDGLGRQLEVLGLKAKKACIVADSRVADLYLHEIASCLNGVISQIDTYVFPEGEASKNLHTVQELYKFLITRNYERKDILIALGGGVTGDLTGFAAATYLRGIDFIQVPTTLLAQVDSSIGGKTGVDLDHFKNMVGAFCQPRLVYMNTSVLSTLSEKQFASGMGEVVKTALLRDQEFFLWLGDHQKQIQAREKAVLEHMIHRCCEIKAQVVAEDPKEQGIRATLNLGHTIGHAIEKRMDFQLLHGECVALGLAAAAFLSCKKGYISREDQETILHTLKEFRLPVHFQGVSPEKILETTKSDKKMENGQIKFILLHPMGNAVIDKTVTDAEILEAVRKLNGESIYED